MSTQQEMTGTSGGEIENGFGTKEATRNPAGPPQSDSQGTESKTKKPQAGGMVHFVAGGVGGMLGAIVTSPLEVVKTRMQSSLYNVNPRMDLSMQPPPPPTPFTIILCRYCLHAIEALSTTPTTTTYYYYYAPFGRTVTCDFFSIGHHCCW